MKIRLKKTGLKIPTEEEHPMHHILPIISFSYSVVFYNNNKTHKITILLAMPLGNAFAVCKLSDV